MLDHARSIGVVIDPVTFTEATRTAEQAASALGCDVGAIVKSLVFVVDDVAVVALIPGDRRLDTDALCDVVGGSSARRATLDEVRSATGFVAGGTPPFGHTTPVPVFADPSLRRHDPVWAAGGTPHTVFAISLADLDRVSAPTWASIAS